MNVIETNNKTCFYLHERKANFAITNKERNSI